MNRNHIVSVFALCLVAVAFPASSGMDMPDTYREMEDIVDSQSFTQEQKLAAISSYFKKEPFWPGALHRLDRVDETRAREIALNLFRQPETSRLHKYQLANYMLRAQTPNHDRKPGDPPGFITEYREFLINAILDGGKEEFCASKSYEETAVGEYAGIAGGVAGPGGILFSDVADTRVIPVLIDCLSAPDHVYPNEQGCIVRGIPGEPTGRNTQRQGIPLALMRLEATEAIPALQRIANEHHDLYLRKNASKALVILELLAEMQNESTANKPSERTR